MIKQHSAIFSIVGESSACQVPTCAVAAIFFDNPHQQLVPRSRIPGSTSHFSYMGGGEKGVRCVAAARRSHPLSA